MHIGSSLDPTISLFEPCKDSLDQWSKRFCLQTIQTGVNKQVSSSASIEFYNSVIEGVRGYHNTVLSGVEVNNSKLALPPKVKLDVNNIPKAQLALLDSYRQSNEENNPYQQLRSFNGKYYSISHDGIQKFSKELNGVYVRTLSGKSLPVHMPWSLTEIPGGSLNAKKLVKHVINTIADIKPVRENAYTEVPKILHNLANSNAESGIVIPSSQPPEFFKLCSVVSVEGTEINLEFKEWPVTVMADGCSTNVAAANKLSECFGFVTPNIRCTVHAADGSMKRLTNSKTMNVPEFSEFLPPFKTILRHFQLSGKSTSLLNNALEVLDLKTIHMMTFCPTRMAYLLSACAQVVKLLVPICDVLTTCGIKEEEREIFLSPKFQIILHILADLEPIFQKDYLKVLDSDDNLIISAYNVALKFVDHLTNSFKPERLNKFIEGLEEDANGNIIVHLKLADNTHGITLNYNHRPSRRMNSKLDAIKALSESLKTKLLENVTANVIDQSQSGTLVEMASAFDMSRTITLEERVVYLKQLHTLFGTNYVHKVNSEALAELEDDVGEWNHYTISITYPKKINASEDELTKQFRNIWPIFNQTWPKYREQKKTSHIDFFEHILSNHTITHPDLCEMVKILLAVAPSTGPLERSYSKLAKICYKDRNKILSKNLEILYLLSALNFPKIDYDKAISILEK